MLFIAELLQKVSRVLSPFYKKEIQGPFVQSCLCVETSWPEQNTSPPDLQLAPAVYRDSSILNLKQRQPPTSHNLSSSVTWV